MRDSAVKVNLSFFDVVDGLMVMLSILPPTSAVVPVSPQAVSSANWNIPSPPLVFGSSTVKPTGLAARASSTTSASPVTVNAGSPNQAIR
jgi:hypothetical protein